MANDTSKSTSKGLRLQSKPRSWQAREALYNAISEMLSFTTAGSLSGERRNGYLPGYGRLAGADLDAAREQDGNVDYVVMSYATPIAWHVEGYGWHVVRQTFSVTTGAQQSIVRAALNVNYGDSRPEGTIFD